MRIALFPYAPVADRVWELRDNLNAYDPWYVAVPEMLGVGLATLDGKLASAAGSRCPFVMSNS
jgi:predicted nucleic acid-binding protein